MWQTILYILIGLIVGAVVTFFITRYFFTKQLKENPPITEKQIRVMFQSMGMRPSEAKIQQVLRSMGIQPSTNQEKKQPYINENKKKNKEDSQGK